MAAVEPEAMVGSQRYSDREISFTLYWFWEKKAKREEVPALFEHEFGREMLPKQLRYVLNKYSTDPKYGCPKHNGSVTFPESAQAGPTLLAGAVHGAGSCVSPRTAPPQSSGARGPPASAANRKRDRDEADETEHRAAKRQRSSSVLALPHTPCLAETQVGDTSCVAPSAQEALARD
ncbi:hypothetical protein CDD81_4407 [Ophiocordyceps australis]|uniref:Uncharacterized protein n=1 Tax=Ophiocordyceps australis TaxID=1399860 RepID=A0A2C5YI89_9HYPO|nr:hypothetical protein CDD81_4407 [Ophiocordyceps australis]